MLSSNEVQDTLYGGSLIRTRSCDTKRQTLWPALSFPRLNAQETARNLRSPRVTGHSLLGDALNGWTEGWNGMEGVLWCEISVLTLTQEPKHRKSSKQSGKIRTSSDLTMVHEMIT